MNCLDCIDASINDDDKGVRDCRRCYFSQTPALNDRFYLEAVRPYCWFAAFLLFLSYAIGLWFTLRTHAAVIWNSEVEEKKQSTAEHHQVSGTQQSNTPRQRLQRQPTNISAHTDSVRGAEIRESQLYKRILGQSLKSVGLSARHEENSRHNSTQLPQSQNGVANTPHLVPPKSAEEGLRSDLQIPGFSDAQNSNLVREVAELAATAATIAARDAQRPRKASVNNLVSSVHSAHRPNTGKAGTIQHDDEAAAIAEALAHGGTGGGHDAPNWSRMKSSIILMVATILYALIAEILVNTVDVVLEGVAIDEKFLGITLFALVPNTTEFLVSHSSTLEICSY